MRILFSSRVDVRVRRHFDEGSCRYPRTLYPCESTRKARRSLDRFTNGNQTHDFIMFLNLLSIQNSIWQIVLVGCYPVDMF